MLFQTVHAPSAYAARSLTEEFEPSYYSTLLGVLRDSAVNCVLLGDQSGRIHQSIEAHISTWPVKYKKKGFEFHEALKKRHRLLRVSEPGAADTPCSAPTCGQVRAVAECSAVDALVVPHDCSKCNTLCSRDIELVSITSWITSNFEERRRRMEKVELPNGRFPRTDFEQKYLYPIFRTAKYVILYDRLIGDHIHPRTMHGRTEFLVKQNYRQGVTWLLNVYLDANPSIDASRFRIFCGLDVDGLEARVQPAAAALRRFVTELQRNGVSPEFRLKRIAGSGRMRHARYLITDQVTLLVERGFDLLHPDRTTMKDVVITHVDKSTAVLNEFYNLQDIK